MSVGKASIARAVNAEKASKTETKTEVKEAEVKAAEKPAEVKAETAEKAARRPFPAASAHHHDNGQVQRAGHGARP